MRIAKIALGAGMFLALANPAHSQDAARPSSLTGFGFAQSFNGVNSRNINFVPIDTTKAMKNMNINSAFKTPAQPKAFSMANIFPKINLPTFPPVVASTPVLNQQNNPFQPNPIVGSNPFSPAPSK